MKTKICFKCNQAKDLSEFYKHPQMADGHLNKCKECNKKDVRKNRAKKIDYYREYDAKRGFHGNPSYLRKWRKENPQKYHAHCMVNNALRDGRLKKQPCQMCGSTKDVHGHHKDYYKPLDVDWLCCICHHKEHPKV